ncbi:LuxR family transcriptional regulator [Streptomyces sp. RKAG293]|uniref:LuxR C-terminal-related transcriptional regulator n=1 Tax=Streptomyces sp. RKAG293 TaxID=2893403 RepID=UPI002033E780|nr:LuxR family transcriptional regulator [Streptomyces sp. RKAG293]MCM2416590.1 LuxR family transcriptional regulator [Streptomyces sp. RKAG293]
MTVQKDSSRWPLTGREDGLEDFTALWRSQDCEGLVIFGSAGVGKTRLADEYLAKAVREGWKGARVSASVAMGAIPLGAVAHLIPPGTDLSDPARGFIEITAKMTRSGRQRRVVLVDDMHTLDAASAVLLRYLLDAHAIRLIGTVRTDALLGEAVRALTTRPAVHRAEVKELGLEETAQLLTSVLGAPVGRYTLHELYRMSGGSVLYLRELVFGALASETLVNDGEIWELVKGQPMGTPRLAELIRAELAAADPAGWAVLDLLALCEPLPLADACAVAASARTVGELKESGLVRFVTDGRRTHVVLTHPLHGEVMRADLPLLRRRALLLGQAERTERHEARRREDALRIATWRLAATGTADQRLLLEAAALARHTDDYTQAAALAEAAWSEARGAQAALSYATALIGLVRHEEADQVLVEAMQEEASEEGRDVLFHARVDNIILLGDLSQAQRLLEGREDTRSKFALATVLYFRGRFHDSVACCHPLMSGPDSKLAVDARAFMSSALLRLGLVDDAAEVFDPLHPLLLRSEEGGGTSLYSDFIDDIDGYAHILNGDLKAAVSILSARHGKAVSQNKVEMASRRATALGFSLMERGRPQSAINVLNSVATKKTHWELFTQWAQANAVICASMTRQTQVADRYLALLSQAGDDIEACNNHLARAWHAWLHHDHPQTRYFLLEAAERTKELDQGLHRVWTVHAMGRLGLANLASPYWDFKVQGEFLNARLDYTRAIARKDVDLLLRVADIFEESGAEIFAAEAFAEAANLQRQKRQVRQASTTTNRASEIAQKCEGVNTPALSHLSAGRGGKSLTNRELEIALLAVSNNTSKDIAGTLDLSVRTVENHLQHAFTKLGVANRRELSDALDET